MTGRDFYAFFSKLLPLSILAATTIILSGCASSATKASVQIVGKSDNIYARVTSVGKLDPDDIAKACEKESASSDRAAKICANRSDYELARVVYFIVDNRLIYGAAAVPKADQIKPKYIIQMEPKMGLARYRQLVATSDTDTCKWIGPTPEFINGSGGIVTGFLAGMLIVPGVVMLASDAMSAGVECNGYSYKSIVAEANRK
ncbi:hypothetical protein [Pseudoduganella rhizocola]|uniref:hypothetical protein n=1 Tax=Pseudoduganella rhizocola TaxID=3382643 RepID=UPI0038B53FDE